MHSKYAFEHNYVLMQIKVVKNVPCKYVLLTEPPHLKKESHCNSNKLDFFHNLMEKTLTCEIVMPHFLANSSLASSLG